MKKKSKFNVPRKYIEKFGKSIPVDVTNNDLALVVDGKMIKEFTGKDADVRMGDWFDKVYASHNHYTVTKIVVEFEENL